MARQIINASDTLPASRPKINENFEELYARRLVREGWDFANAAARDAATLTDDDIGFVCRVAAPLGYFLLRQRTPTVVWEQLGGGSGGAAVGRGAWSARPSTPAVGDYYLCTDLPQTELRCWSAGQWTTYVCGVEVEPKAASYFGSWTNQESATVADVGPFFEMRDGGEAIEWELRSRLRATPASSSYAVEIGLLAHVHAGGAGVVGYGGGVAVAVGDMLFGTGTTRFGVVKTPILINSSHRWSAYVSAGEPQPRIQQAPSFGAPSFFRLRDDGTTRFYECSVDRQTWVIVDQHARGTHAVPANWGPFIATGRLAAQQPRVVIVHAREYTL